MQNLTAYAMTLVGTPYFWGGSNPIEGFDCSGFLQFILRFAGIDPPGDQSAQGLYNHFEKQGSIDVWSPGSLSFYGKDAKNIIHVGFCIDKYRMIHCASGDSTTLTLEIAAKQGACVRGDLIKYRKDFFAVIKPKYASIGLI